MVDKNLKSFCKKNSVISSTIDVKAAAQKVILILLRLLFKICTQRTLAPINSTLFVPHLGTGTMLVHRHL